MDNFPHRLKSALIATALCGCGAVAAQDAASLPITLDADSWSLDRQSNLVHVRGVRIAKGDTSIEASEAFATELDFERSEWRFAGGVRMTVDSAVMEADSAVFKFEARQLQSGELVGRPASFRDQNPQRKQPASGSANKLTYDTVAHTLRMSENAWVTKGPYQTTGCDLIYDFNAERVTAGSSDCTEPFRILVTPERRDTATEPASDP